MAVDSSYKDAPTRAVSAGGVDFAYRELGPKAGVPLIFLVHLAGNLDNWDPRVVDGIAARHRVITFDNRGVGASTGKTPDTIQAMAKDAVTFIRALGFDQVDLHGFSMGGMIAQVIAQDEPELVRKLILTGTGPAGGKGMKEVVWVAQVDTLRGLLSRQDPKRFLFFTRTANGKREGKAFLARLQERTVDRDTPTTVSSYFAQLKACRRWGKEEPHDLSLIRQPVLLANGDNDRMLPTPNTLDMARRLPNNELVVYPDAGHGGIPSHSAGTTWIANLRPPFPAGMRRPRWRGIMENVVAGQDRCWGPGAEVDDGCSGHHAPDVRHDGRVRPR